MKIFVVRIGDKYGPEYETYLEERLPEYDFHWIRKPYYHGVRLQWNKMWPMSSNSDEPVCVMDIDVLLVNDYKKVFEYPVERGEFLAMPGWWRDTKKEGYSLNGGFFKYHPVDCNYIYKKFMMSIDYWQQYYVRNGVTKGPVNGEQYFVEDSVNEELTLKLLPNEWFTRWESNTNDNWQGQITTKYRKTTGNDYIYLGGEFHPDIKFVHFTHSLNKPHEWKDYDALKYK